MNKFIETIKNIWKIEELRNKLILTLGFMAVYRFMAQVSLPGIDFNAIDSISHTDKGGGLLGLINAFTGGAFSRASVMALGVMPYISASIVVQLMGLAVPYLQKLDKEGESGRNKKNQITRWLTILITLVQGPAYVASLGSIGIPESAFMMGHTGLFYISSIILLSTGSIFAMWLGEKITDKGIGNGISLLIMVGIIARFPSAFFNEINSKLAASQGAWIMILLEVVLWFAVIVATVFLVTAIRRVTVQYARRSVIGNIKSVGNARDYIPLRLNAAGVMPIIFAQALMFVPGLLAQADNETIKAIGLPFQNMFGFWYNVVFAIMIIIFSYFYTAITIPTNKMADDLKRGNGFIPGIKPGHATADFLDTILSRITLPGSIFLAFIAIFPAIVSKFGIQDNWALFYGGTSLIIMVGVAIDTIQQINAYLLNHHYDGLMKNSTTRRAKI
ncbi:MAG: preprotein translocase subunit SecY [Flavobacteriia bacterium]|nr:MAG: preprotein translocase subunit SecY [Flavobacteriia bacterium]